MNNDKFVGYFIIGTDNQLEAEQGKGLILWLQKKPFVLRRFLNKVILGIRWVDKEDYKPVGAEISKTTSTSKVEMPKQRLYTKKNGPNKEKGNSTTRPTSDKE
jgi:hypothetical protein